MGVTTQPRELNVKHPLTVIAWFLSLTEVVAGLALGATTVTRGNPSTETVLVGFVVIFPLLVAGAFFLILWKKNQVFYPPSEFAQVDPTDYTKGMQYRNTMVTAQQNPSDEILTKVVSTIKDVEREAGSANDQGEQEGVQELKTEVDSLQTQLSSVSWNYFFEIVYRQIFGSQLAALVRLEMGLSLPETAFAGLYELHVKAMTLAGSQPYGTVEDLLAFLKQRGLASFTSDGKYQVTQAGQWFLAYLRSSSILLWKPY